MFERAMDFLSKDKARDWGKPAKDCPSDNALQEYLEATKNGRGEDDLAPDQLKTRTHASMCKTCYNRLWELMSNEAVSEAREGLKIFEGREKDTAYLTGILTGRGQQDWIRAIAADYLGETGEDVDVKILQKISSDEEENDDVRSAAVEALQKVEKRWVSRILNLPSQVILIIMRKLEPIASTLFAPVWSCDGDTDKKRSAEASAVILREEKSDDGRLVARLSLIGDEFWMELETNHISLKDTLFSVEILTPGGNRNVAGGEGKASDEYHVISCNNIELGEVGENLYGVALSLGRIHQINLDDDSRIVIHFGAKSNESST